MKIAIIGCGYVGKTLAIALKTDGHQISVTTRTDSKLKDLQQIADHVHIVSGNDIRSLTSLLKDQDVVILTLAADNPESYESTYLDTAKALAAAVKYTPHPSRIIYTGSTSVYGDHQGHTVDEETPPTPVHATGKILADTEQQLMSLSSEKRHVGILRLGEIIGPGRELTQRLRNLQGRPLPGTGESLTNLIHLNDIVSAIRHALSKDLNGIYNLCCDLHIPRRELYASICAKEGIPEVVWDPSKTSYHSGNKVVSNAKIKATGFAFGNGPLS